MDQRQFMQWMEADKLPDASVDALRQIVAEYPYFQSAHALLAKAMADNHDMLYDKHLKIAAAYSADRKSLYQLIHRKVATVFTPAKEEEHPSPFVLSDKEDTAPLVQTEIPEVVETRSDAAVAEVAPEPVLPFQATFIPEPIISSPPVEDAPIEDPHEIIRRRLAEILGAPAEEIKKEKEVSQSPSTTQEETVAFVAPSAPEIQTAPDEKAEQPIIHKEEPIVPVAEQTPSAAVTQENIVEEKVEDKAEDKSASITQATNTEEAIFKASETALDDVDKLQLEYALEYSIISSIENLPVIEQPKERVEEVKKEIAATTPDSNPFLHWLKQSSVDGFGSVEEVHADDNEESKISNQDTSAETETAEAQKEPEAALIDRFIATEPRIVPSKNEFYSPANQAKKSVTEHEDLVSETLAKIYLLQGHPLKALKCYEKLSLLQPEKKTYFAALIKEIESSLNNSENQDL